MRMLRWGAVSLLLSTMSLSAQSLTSLTGSVTDPSGAVIPGTKLTLVNVDTATQRDEVADTQGRYSFSQLQPGTYRLTAKATGFNDVVVSDVRLLVSTPATLNISFEKIGATMTTVQVEAAAVQVNTTDASLGNAVGGKVISQLPFEGRNVVGLLAIQPGVVYLGDPDPSKLNDYRSGAVNGGKSDQANVTLDGIDVNDRQDGSAFKSVLRVTLDSVQEFRTTTTGGGADQGRTSGAQVTLITKGGSNTIHGSAYEYLRNTLTSANDFFNNKSGLPRQKLNRNVFGGSVGGPIKKDRFFYFLNYEGRRDASETTGARIVPLDNLRQGLFKYTRKDGTVGTLTPADVKNTVDPAHIGEDPAILAMYNLYPHANDTTIGDGLNTGGFRFNASTPLRWNTYTAKFDYLLDQAGKHQLFARGNLQNDNYANGIPQFPGQPPVSVYLENSKGYGLGYTALLKPTLVSTFRYGLTRQGAQNTGVQTQAVAYPRDMDSLYPQGTTARGLARIIPVHTFTEDLTWTKGAHTIAFGGAVRLISNTRDSTRNSFSDAYMNSSWLSGTGGTFLVADAASATAYKRQMTDLLGILSELDHQVNYDLKGNALAEGALVSRKFVGHEYEMYAQDTWKVTRGLTVTAGLRYSLSPPISEVNGYQTSSNIPLADWFDNRGKLADQGLPQSQAGVLSFNLASAPGGRPLYPFQKKDFAPRIAIAYSPTGDSGLSKFLTGGPGKSSIRAGFGLYYDAFGQALARDSNAASLGFSTLLTNSAVASPLTSPRFTGFYDVPLSQFVPAPKGGFPQTEPDVFAITNGVDDKISAPYTMNTNFSVGREFKGGFFVEASYVGRFARKSLIGDDVAMSTNLKDPASGMTFFQAAGLLSNYTLSNTAVGNVPKIPFWENIWPGAAGGGLTATQAIYKHYLGSGGDFTTALTEIDGQANGDGTCDPACSKFGPNAIFNPQYGSLWLLRSVGYGDYNAMQWTIRKRFSQGYQFDFNYTWSKSIDLASRRETDTAGGGGQILNAFAPDQMRAVSDYDTTHVFSALAAAELPFGKGKTFLRNANGFLDALFGGWQLSGVFRNTSGFPVSVGDGVGWPTNWSYSGFATQTGIVPGPQQTKNAPSALKIASGGPNVFSDPLAAFNAYSFTIAGQSGQRNGIRGDGVFGIDMGLGKRFKLFTVKDQPHTLQFRAEGFNITNTVRFDVNPPAPAPAFNLSAANQAKFGQYTTTLTKPRVFQFSARYEF